MKNIFHQSTKNIVSHHIKWPICTWRGLNSIAFWGGGGARGKVLLRISGSYRKASVDNSSLLGSWYSAESLKSIGWNVAVNQQKIGDSTQESSGHLLYHCPDMSFCSSLSPNTNEKHVMCHQWTLHTLEAPREVYLSTSVLSLACSTAFHSRSTRCASSFGIRTSGFPFARFDSDHLLLVQRIGIWIIHCAACCWAS
jgi:hypothetical protein